jgi:hypothetical protein
VDKSINQLWAMRSPLGLFGNTFDGAFRFHPSSFFAPWGAFASMRADLRGFVRAGKTGEWKNTNSGIGAGDPL